MKKLIFSIFILTSIGLIAQTTIETQLVVTTNEGTNGGAFRVAVQAKGTNLTANNTIGSATLDVYFNSADIAPVIIVANNVQGTFNANITTSAYTRSITYVASGPYIRLSLTGSNVNSNFDGTPAGFDLTSTYQTLATINFTISNNAAITNLTVGTGSLTIGLFSTHNNEDFTGLINPQTMSTPINMTNVPLPVELSSFKAKMYNDDKVKLNWSTKTETNNYGFDVERQANEGQWEKVGFVNGYGNSNSPKEYSFIDKDLIGGSKFLYRLKQVDNDGQFEYSNVVEVEVVPNNYSLSQNYPNPFNPNTNIRYSLKDDKQFVSLVVYDILGNEIQTLVNEEKSAGTYELNWSAINFPSGIYFYRLKVGSFVETRKMTLLK